MDEFKPEDELKPDPSDRPARNRKSGGNNEPQINFDGFDLEDEDDVRPSRSRAGRDGHEAGGEDTPRRQGKRNAVALKGPISRQHLMMALGILVLLLLIFAIGSALNSSTTAGNSSEAGSQAAGRSVDLSSNEETAAAVGQENSAQPQAGAASAATPVAPREITLPEVSSTPTQGEVAAVPENQRRVEVPGDLNNALMQQQGQIDNAASGSTLPTEPATVAPVRGRDASRPAARNEQSAAGTSARERQRAVIEPARKAESNQSRPQAAARNSETKPAASASGGSASKTPATTGNIGALTSAPGNHYTLQLSSSSNYNNLNAWAKKEKLNNAVVYKTTRNGQPWYVLVSGVYASKDEARRAVSTLPADVQAKNPWTKPIHQVQADLKQ